MKLVTFTLCIEIPEDETEPNYEELLSEMEEVLAKKNCDVYDTEWSSTEEDTE